MMADSQHITQLEYLNMLYYDVTEEQEKAGHRNTESFT